MFLEEVTDAVLELLPRITVQAVAELAITVHFRPAVPTPFAARHIDQKVPIFLRIVYVGIVALLPTGSRRETHNLPLLDERNVGPDPRLILVHVLESVLLLVLPLHVFLLVANWIPPYIQQPVGPCASPDHE